MDQISKGKCISPMDPMGFGLLLIALLVVVLFVDFVIASDDDLIENASCCLFQSPNGD